MIHLICLFFILKVKQFNNNSNNNNKIIIIIIKIIIIIVVLISFPIWNYKHGQKVWEKL